MQSMTANPKNKPGLRGGIISLTIGLVTGLGTCLYLAAVWFMIFSGGGDFGFSLGLTCINGIQGVIALLNMTGLILAIRALVRKDAKKGFAIAGLVVNLFGLFVSIAILWFSISTFITVI